MGTGHTQMGSGRNAPLLSGMCILCVLALVLVLLLAGCSGEEASSDSFSSQFSQDEPPTEDEAGQVIHDYYLNHYQNNPQYTSGGQKYRVDVDSTHIEIDSGAQRLIETPRGQEEVTIYPVRAPVIVTQFVQNKPAQTFQRGSNAKPPESLTLARF